MIKKKKKKKREKKEICENATVLNTNTKENIYDIPKKGFLPRNECHERNSIILTGRIHQIEQVKHIMCDRGNNRDRRQLLIINKCSRGF